MPLVDPDDPLRDRHFLIPFAAVSLNHAYKPVTRGGRTVVRLVDAFVHFKEWVQHTLADVGDPPSWPTYECEYVFLFEEEEIWTSSLRGSAKARSKGLLQRKDISNFFKLLEDALFDWLFPEGPAGVDGMFTRALAQDKDERVADLHGYKRACKILPCEVERYGLKNLRRGRYPRGVVLIRLAPGPGFEWRAPDALYERFRPLLEGTRFEFLPQREGGVSRAEAAEWFEVPQVDGQECLDLRREHRAYSGAPHDRARGRILQQMLRDRVAWWATHVHAPPESVAHAVIDPEALRDSWRARVGWGSPKTPGAREKKIKLFDRGEAWAAHLLAEECTPRTMARLTVLGDAARRLAATSSPPHASRVLVVGSGAGAWVEPFLGRGLHVDVVELRGSAVLRALRARVRKGLLGGVVRPVARYDQRKPYAEGEYDLVVCLDIVDRVRFPRRLLRRLVRATRGRFAVAYTFKDHPGIRPPKSNRGVIYPWVRSENAKASEINRYLTAVRDGLGMRTSKGSTFRDDIVLLERRGG